MHAAHPSSMMVQVDDNIMRSFPITHVEIKIRVPDQLIGRLIGKNGVCLKKIMDETLTHITINDFRSQHEVQHYQSTEIIDRVITIRGTSLGPVLQAEKNVQQKLRQFVDQDMNINIGPQYYNASGVIVNQVENIGTYIAPGSVPAPMLPRDNTYPAAAYNAIPIGVSPQSFYIQTPTTVPNFSINTGQYGHTIPPSAPSSNMPKPIHIKSRVYVPNSIVGILIGAKGQTIKSVIADSGAIISVEGDHPKKIARKEIQNDNKEINNSSVNNNAKDNSQPETEDNHGEKITLKSMRDVEPICQHENGDDSDTKKTTDLEEDKQQGNGEVRNESETKKEKETVGMTAPKEQELNGSKPHNQALDANNSQENNHFNGGNKKNNANHSNNQMAPDQRGVFIQGYDYQVSKALYWVFQKVSENQNSRPEDIMLTCEAIVPCKVIGRIIGKQGQNVKQLQMRSGATIKVPDDINQNDKSCMEAAVRVVGNFYAVQMVQQHFGTLILDAELRESKEYDERRSRFRENSR